MRRTVMYYGLAGLASLGLLVWSIVGHAPFSVSYRDGEHIRESMHRRFGERLRDSYRPFVLVTESRGERVATAERTIRALVALRGWTWPDYSSTGS